MVTKRVKGGSATKGTEGTRGQGGVLDQAKASTEASRKKVRGNGTAKLGNRQGREIGIGFGGAKPRKADTIGNRSSREPHRTGTLI